MQLYYEETGAQDAPVIVFIHGIGAGSWMWWEQTEEFKDYRCINVDLPGHGNSVDVPWVSVDDTAGKIIQLIEGNFPGERVHIVGLSLGGHMVMELILKYPGMFQSAFVSGITTRPAINWLTGKIQIYMFERMKNNPKAVERLAEERYRLEGERKIQFKRDLDKMSMETYSEIVDEVLRFKLHDGFRTVDVPLMVTAGEDESAIIKESVFEIPEMMPNASGKLIPHAGHGWNVTMPKTFNKECRHWIEAHA